MSASSGKSKFFGFLKNVFQKSSANGNGGVPSAKAEAPRSLHGAPPIETAPRPRTSLPPKRGQNGNGTAMAQGNGHEHAGNGHNAPAAARNVATLQVSLQAIINGLPLELRAKVVHPEVGDVAVAVPLDKVLSQLAQGVVKIPFGDVRQSAPYAFASEADGDRIAVTLPLNEILSQLNPALLVRRPAQKCVEVPSDITSPFDAKGQGLVFSVGNNAKPVTPASSRQVAPAPATPARGSISSVPVQPPPTASAPPASLPQAMPIPMPKFTAPAAPVPPAVQSPSIAPISPLIPAEPFGKPLSMSSAAPIPRVHHAHPVQTPAPVQAAPASDAGSLTVALKALADGWPEALRHEIVQGGLVDAQVALPCDAIEPALKRGRAVFTWKTLRSWIRPASVPGVSVHDAAELELPLRVIAPLFLARQSSATKTHPNKHVIDETIPNLFFGFPRPEPAPSAQTPSSLPRPGAPASVTPAGNLVTAPTKPADTNYYVWSDTTDTTRFDEAEVKKQQQAPAPSGTDFVARYATPNEIVSRAAVLDGVAGALIALPDGLMVASRISSELNGDTLAAFLPQIFAKVNQCTRELRMGELNNLNFTVGNVPWKIFRVNAIFFAAFGRVAQALPTAELAALAAELDRKR